MTKHPVSRAELSTAQSDQLEALIRDGLAMFDLSKVGIVDIPLEVADGPATGLITLLAAVGVLAANSGHLLVIVAFRDLATATLVGPTARGRETGGAAVMGGPRFFVLPRFRGRTREHIDAEFAAQATGGPHEGP